jgi:hypothetical protein
MPGVKKSGGGTKSNSLQFMWCDIGHVIGFKKYIGHGNYWAVNFFIVIVICIYIYPLKKIYIS